MHPLYIQVGQSTGLRRLAAAGCWSAVLSRYPREDLSLYLKPDHILVVCRLRWWWWAFLGLRHVWVWVGIKREVSKALKPLKVGVRQKVRVR